MDPARTADSRRPGPRVGLVLGGGGAVGAAYHAGVLAALVFDLGWDPRAADLVIGTSAGSLVGALLRAGVPVDDIAALLVDKPLRVTPQALGDAARRPDPFPPGLWRTLLRPLRIPHPRSTLTALHHLYRHRDPSALLTALAPQGLIDMAAFLAFLDDDERPWPDGFWAVAVREPGLQRAVFGGEYTAILGEGVAASCAIPGIARPVKIGGHRFVDGGVRSPTNADLLLRAPMPLDLAVVVSPMSGAGVGLHPGRGVQALATRHLRAELRVLERAGIPTVVFEPSRALRRVMGHDLLDRDRAGAVLRGAYLETGEQLLQRSTRVLLGGLADRAERLAA